MKICNGCLVRKDFTMFSPKKSGKFGVAALCKACNSEKYRKYYLSNKEIIKKQTKIYRIVNCTEISSKRKLFYSKNRERIIKNNVAAERKRLAKDKDFRIRHNMRTYMRRSIKMNRKSGRTINLLGCSIDYLKTYLESLFKPGMTWENHGLHGWHIDHILPLSRFNSADEEDMKIAWHFSNLQPLWAKENFKKGNKIQMEIP